MKFIRYFSTLFYCGFLFSCVNFNSKDPRLIKNHNTILTLKNDTILVDELKKIVVDMDTITYARAYNLTQRKIRNLLNSLVDISVDVQIIEADLFLDFSQKEKDLENLSIDYLDIKKVSFFYVESDILKYDFYDLLENTKKTYKNLYQASCDTSIMFYLTQEDIKHKALLTLSLKQKEMPEKSQIKFSKKENDELYKIQSEFFEKRKFK